jgi:hypothetical protein
MVDLGLKRVSAENEVHEAFIQITRRVQGHVIQPSDKELTVEEKRAFLGCYYLYSCVGPSPKHISDISLTNIVDLLILST